MISSETRLGLRAGVAPCRDPVAAQDDADGLRVRRRDRGDVQAQLEARAPPRHPHHPIAEASAVSFSPSAAVASAMPESGCRWSTCGGVDQPVHRGVDRRGGAAPAVQAEVERGDHLVLALDARVDVDQRAQPVQPQHGQPGRGQRAEVAAGSLDPQQLHRLTGDRVGLGALRRGVAAGVVGVARVGAQPVGPGDQVCDRRGSSSGWSCLGRAGERSEAHGLRLRGGGSGAPAGLGAADPVGGDRSW